MWLKRAIFASQGVNGYRRPVPFACRWVLQVSVYEGHPHSLADGYFRFLSTKTAPTETTGRAKDVDFVAQWIEAASGCNSISASGTWRAVGTLSARPMDGTNPGVENNLMIPSTSEWGFWTQVVCPVRTNHPFVGGYTGSGAGSHELANPCYDIHKGWREMVEYYISPEQQRIYEQAA